MEGGSLKTSCPCSTSSHSVFYPRFLNFHCLFRSSWLSADNAIRVSLHVHYASKFRSIVKMSMVPAPPQGQHRNEKSLRTTVIIKYLNAKPARV